MTALTGDRATPERGVEQHAFFPAAGALIRRGALVAITAAAELVAAGPVPGLTVVGVAQTGTADGPYPVTLTPGQLPTGGVVTTGGPTPILTRRGHAWAFVNSAGADLIGLGDWGHPAYAVDDQTVAKTDGGGTRPLAGTIRGVDAAGVWVQV